MIWRERRRRWPAGPATDDQDERTFADLVDRAFELDAEAIGRVRALALAQPIAPAGQAAASRHPWFSQLRLALPVATAFAIVALVGVVIFGGPGGTSPTSGPATDQSAILAVDLARSASRLNETTTAIGTGDHARIGTALMAYRAGLLDVEADLHRPGADPGSAATSLGAQATELSGLAGSVPAEELALYQDVSAVLDRIISALPDHPTPSDHPGNTDHPTPSDHPGNTDHPTPSDHPGNADHPTPSDHPGNNDHPTPHP